MVGMSHGETLAALHGNDTAEVDDLHQVTERLGQRLRRDDGVTRHFRAHEERIEDRAGDAGDEVEREAYEAAQRGMAAPPRR